MSKRTWIKIYVDPWLNGSIRKLSPFERGVWIDVLVLAGSGSYGDLGLIALTSNQGVNDQDIASILTISMSKWKLCKRLFRDLNMIHVYNENGKKNVMKIVNWSKYQSEYGRQKSYRVKLQEMRLYEDPPKLHTRSRSRREVDVEQNTDKKNVDNSTLKKNNGSGFTQIGEVADEIIPEQQTSDIEPF